MAGIKANVEIVDSGFHPGAIFTTDGVLMVFRKGFPTERIQEAMQHISFTNDVTAFAVVRAAIRIPPLPLGLIGGLFAGIIQFATGRHVTEIQLTLNDGATVRLKAEPEVVAQMQKALVLSGPSRDLP